MGGYGSGRIRGDNGYMKMRMITGRVKSYLTISRVNPPKDVYATNTFCIRCRKMSPKTARRCAECKTMVRHNTRHLKAREKEISRY